MKKEEHQSLGYDYDFVGGEFNTYIFETTQNVFYEIKFKPFFIFLILSLFIQIIHLNLEWVFCRVYRQNYLLPILRFP